MTAVHNIQEEAIRKILETVHDPEVPVLSVLDLGIVKGISVEGEKITITVTPTYSGCPAMDVIRMQIRMALIQQGYRQVEILTVVSPPWTTDWISEEGKRKLTAYGIAPPHYHAHQSATALFEEEQAVACPHCRSFNTHLVSQFGSTACKALYKCGDCNEPFDYFKCH